MLSKKPLALAVNAALGFASAMTVPQVMAQEDASLEEVIVTGSRIQRANLVTSSPVQQLDAEQLAFTGVTRAEDVLAQLPQVTLNQSSGQAIEADGTATLELRQLGASRTLVLLNGRRLPQASPSSTVSAGDINFIPMQLVKRVEVLTGGASSTYGADAVAGVVNFILQDDFEGIKLDYQFSQYRHDNDGGFIQREAAESGFPFANDTANDGDTDDITFIMGGNLNEGRGNITAYATYRDIEGIQQSERDYSACAIRSTEGPCLGSATNQAGSFYFDNDGFSDIFFVDGNNFEPGLGQLFNFAPPSYLQRPDERTNLGAFGRYELTEQIEVYTELMFMDTRSTTQFGPAGVFFNTLDFNCGNPLLSDQQRDVVGCTGAPDDQRVTTIFGRRNVEGGPRFGDLRHTTYRGLFGLRGDINETWSYDVSYQYAEVDMRNRNGNYISIARVDNALDVNPDGTCINTDGGNCVPYNLFETGGVTEEQLGYVGQQYFERGTTDQEVWQGFVTGNLGDYGVKLPWAESGVSVVLGIEYRDESLEYQPDDAALAGQVGGLGAALTPIKGDYNVWDYFAEASVPLVEGKDFFQSVVLDLGYRYSDYDPSGETTDTYKVALGWDINEQIKLRGSFQRAVRAPNLADQFEPISGGLFAMDNDPCGGVVNGVSQRGYTFEQCARSGVTQAIWDAGGPADSPAAQYNTITGGDPGLAPEESDTYSFGFIVSPNFIPGLSVSVDYYDIKVEDAITSIAEETTLLQCIETGQFCDSVARGQNDTLWLGLAAPGNGIQAQSTNIGFFQTKGVDVEITYNLDMGEWGSLNFVNIYGYIDEWTQEEYPGAGEISCEGVYGGSCVLPLAENRNRFQATWASPWDVTVNLTWRYIDEVEQAFTANDPIDIDSQDYIDLAATWAVTDYATLRLGMNNIMDEKPPFVAQGVTARENGNTYPGIYDPLGQYWFAGVSFQF
jgi:outer membrane receptor protein involved in Fe transport